MGVISDIVQDSKPKDFVQDARQQGRAIWQEVFGTNKEDQHKPGQKPVPGGSWNRSAETSQQNATARFIQQMRSRAPGGWRDNRFEQGSGKHFIGIAYVAIHRILRQYSQSEFKVYHRDSNHPDGKVEVTEQDPPEGDRMCRPYDLVRLLEKPNTQDSFGKMMYRIGQQMYLTGMYLNYMVPNTWGAPHELYVLPTALAIPQPASNPDFPEGYYRMQPVYPYGPFSSYPTPFSSVGATIDARWIIRGMFPDPLLRYEGWSPLSALKFELDEFEMIGRSRHSTMRRSIRPSAVLNMTEVEGAQSFDKDEVARIHAEWENEFQGTDNHGKLIVGVPGGTLEEWGTHPVDMDYPAGWEQLASFLLGGFGITKPAAGLVDDAAYANLWASLKQLHALTLKPDLDDIAADMTRSLGPFFGDDLVVEIRCPRIDDHDVLFMKIDKAMQAKAITKRDLLKLLDLPIPEDADWLDDIAGDPSPKEEEQMQAQMQPGMPGQEASPEMQGPEQQELDATLGLGGDLFEEDEEEPPPETGNPGGLGPRKELVRAFHKSLREKYRKQKRLVERALLGNGENGAHHKA